MPGRQLRFNPLAEAELFEAARWYDERSLGLGAAFVDAVHDATTIVLDEIVAVAHLKRRQRYLAKR